MDRELQLGAPVSVSILFWGDTGDGCETRLDREDKCLMTHVYLVCEKEGARKGKQQGK